MTDSISDSDVRRVDENVDPTAVNRSDIEDALPDDFEGEGRSAFAERVEGQRSEVRDEAKSLLGSRLTSNPANGKTQLRDESGRFGPMASSVEGTRLESDGTVYADVEGGSDVRLGSVDLDAGASGGRSANW
jgi:hypothetical protein